MPFIAELNIIISIILAILEAFNERDVKVEDMAKERNIYFVIAKMGFHLCLLDKCFKQ